MATFDHISLADEHPAPRLVALHGRGAVANIDHRFQSDTRKQVDDGWSAGGADTPIATPRRLATPIKIKCARTLMAHNTSPDISSITDDHLERIVAEAAIAGAVYGNYTLIRLPYEVKSIFEACLHAYFPDRAQRVLHRIEDMRGGGRNDFRFGVRMRGTGPWAHLLKQRFEVAARPAGLNRQRLQRNTTLFTPPARPVRTGSPVSMTALRPNNRPASFPPSNLDCSIDIEVIYDSSRHFRPVFPQMAFRRPSV